MLEDQKSNCGQWDNITTSIQIQSYKFLFNLAYLDIGFVLVVVAVFKIEKMKREFVFIVSICS